jgi:hypothetical protein
MTVQGPLGLLGHCFVLGTLQHCNFSKQINSPNSLVVAFEANTTSIKMSTSVEPNPIC